MTGAFHILRTNVSLFWKKSFCYGLVKCLSLFPYHRTRMPHYLFVYSKCRVKLVQQFWLGPD